MSVVSATSKGSDKSDSSQPNLKARVRLQPQRDAPPPPPATTTASTVNRPEKSPVAITSPLSNAAAATTARVDEATFSSQSQIQALCFPGARWTLARALALSTRACY